MMFKIGDKVKMKPYYGETIENMLGLKSDTIYIVDDIDTYEKDVYLIFVILGEQIYLKADFFDLVKKIGFSLDEV